VTAETLLRLALVPLAVWLASLAARKWGHSVSGYLGGFPLIGGPITLYLALDHGTEFAARSATVTLAVIVGQAIYLIAFSRFARRHRWPVALVGGWLCFAAVALVVLFVPLSPGVALALAVLGLATAWRLLPHPREDAPPPSVPPVELRLRLAAALLLAIAILWGSKVFGPVVSGVLLSVPVTGSIMPPFTLALYGPDAVARLARGFVVGLSGFTAFFFVVAAGVVPLGITLGFLAAVTAALAMSTIASRVLRVEAIEEAGVN
jgi:uncharacterized membrane protein (GlpM family)